MQNMRKALRIHELNDAHHTLYSGIWIETNHAHQAVLSGRCQVKAEAAYKYSRRLHEQEQQTEDMEPAAQCCLMGYPIESTKQSTPCCY